MMRKIYALVVFAGMMASLWSGAAFASYWDEGNDGDSWETAYIIDSEEDFMQMRQSNSSGKGKYYKLTKDLDLTSLIGNSTEYKTSLFYGHLDGQGHTLQINIVNTGSMTLGFAIFDMVSADSVAIRNLNVTGSIRTSDNSGFVGGIADMLVAGTIENCSFTGTIEAAESAGGIVGTVERNASVKDCTFSGNITVSGENSATVGGIAAAMVGGSIENCNVLSGTTLTCNVQQGTQNIYAGGVGGIAGMTTTILKASSVTNCKSEAELRGNASWKGGIVGMTGDNEYIPGPRTTLSGNSWPSKYSQVGYGAFTSNNSNPVTPNQPTTPVVLPVGTIQPVKVSDDVLAKVAAAVSVDVSQINVLTAENITEPQEPTQSMRDYSNSDNTSFTGKLNTLTVDAEGWYVFKVSLSEELWEKVKDQSTSGYKFYALNDSDAEVSAAVLPLNGIAATWEIFTLNGEKLKQFGLKEFLMVGFLNAGKPLSVYIAKILLMLLAGGCNIGISTISLLSAIFFALKIRRR